MRSVRALLSLLGLLFALTACGAPEVWAPQEAVTQASYSHSGPTSVTLFTMINNRTGSGGHSALMINGSERILFDPAGSWRHPTVPERNDVLYGITPQMLDFFVDYHARETYHVVLQELLVSPEIAQQLTLAVQAYGPVPQAQCSLSLSRILSATPGFEGLGQNMFPARNMAEFAELPGVETSRVYDDDADNNSDVLDAQVN
jgi:hypothetical protein